jgi:nitrite reductase/ring-hydroxylating ferredoxin subunit
MTHDDSFDGSVDARGAADKSECVRRSVLRGAVVLGAVGVGGALSFIGGGSSGSASLISARGTTPVAGTGAAAAPAGAAPAGAAPAGAAPAAGAPAGARAAKGRLVGPASKIPVGGGAIFDKAQVVVTQPTAGVYKAFDAMCTHEKCILAEVADGTINCACHGGKFSITDGSAVQIPPIDPLPPKTVTVAGGKVYVA